MIELPFEVPERAPAKQAPKSSMREVILAVLAARDREFTSAEISELLHEHYDWRQPSVRSLLTKMATQGQIARPARGVYRALGPSDGS
jgi:predicted transcriptional regulator